MYRFDNEIIFEEKKPTDPISEDPAALVLEKDGNYWLYHKGAVEDFNEERQQPATKAWHIVKYVHNDPGSFLNKGYKVKIGDTIKFGRVRFKVIMLSNFYDGFQVYQPVEFTAKNRKSRKRRNGDENTESEGEEEGEANAHRDGPNRQQLQE